MTDETPHPLPVQWHTTEAYRRALAIAQQYQREHIARLERERCETGEEQVA